MTVFTDPDRSCMRFRATRYQGRRSGRRAAVGRPAEATITGVEKAKNIVTKKEIAELLFETCTGCKKMAAIPQSALTACKVRRNLERNTMISHPVDKKEKTGKDVLFNARLSVEGRELTPMKYNSKLMNSIWGLYNRYSVHNFKKNTDANDGAFGSFVAVLGAAFDSHAPAANNMAAAAAAKNNS